MMLILELPIVDARQIVPDTTRKPRAARAPRTPHWSDAPSQRSVAQAEAERTLVLLVDDHPDQLAAPYAPGAYAGLRRRKHRKWRP